MTRKQIWIGNFKSLVRRGGPLLYRAFDASVRRVRGKHGMAPLRLCLYRCEAIIAGDPATGDLGARLRLREYSAWSIPVGRQYRRSFHFLLSRIQYALNLLLIRIEFLHVPASARTRKLHLNTVDLTTCFPQGTPVNWPIDLPHAERGLDLYG